MFILGGSVMFENVFHQGRENFVEFMGLLEVTKDLKLMQSLLIRTITKNIQPETWASLKKL